MRIAISIEVLDLRRGGGAEIVTLRLIEALARRGLGNFREPPC
ncbi:MAG TPA: hypothetical protein VIJ24_03200 [Verrucomicrobiae bacterium]|jgi:hypothetical protein